MFMKKTWYLLVGLVVAAFLAAVPVYAASVLVSDADLDGISARAMFVVAGTPAAASLDEGTANSQTGSYLWSDNHSTDASNHKGANDANGATSLVQNNVVATSNILSWGAASSGSGLVGDATDVTQSGVSSATQRIGGF